MHIYIWTNVITVEGFQFGCRDNQVVEVVDNCIEMPVTEGNILFNDALNTFLLMVIHTYIHTYIHIYIYIYIYIYMLSSHWLI